MTVLQGFHFFYGIHEKHCIFREYVKISVEEFFIPCFNQQHADYLQKYATTAAPTTATK